jgi:hypothetical protein
MSFSAACKAQIHFAGFMYGLKRVPSTLKPVPATLELVPFPKKHAQPQSIRPRAPKPNDFMH